MKQLQEQVDQSSQQKLEAEAQLEIVNEAMEKMKMQHVEQQEAWRSELAAYRSKCDGESADYKARWLATEVEASKKVGSSERTVADLQQALDDARMGQAEAVGRAETAVRQAAVLQTAMTQADKATEHQLGQIKLALLAQRKEKAEAEEEAQRCRLAAKTAQGQAEEVSAAPAGWRRECGARVGKREAGQGTVWESVSRAFSASLDVAPCGAAQR